MKGLGGIECLSRLEQLRLESTEINDIEPLARLTNLKRLRLHSPHVNDLTPLARLHKPSQHRNRLRRPGRNHSGARAQKLLR